MGWRDELIRRRFSVITQCTRRSQWPRGLRHESTFPSLAGVAGSNPASSMDVCFEGCVLSGRGLCVGPITRPEESYRARVCLIVMVKPR